MLQKSKPSSSRHQPVLSNDEDIFDKPAAAASDARIETGILKIQIAKKLERYDKE